MNKMNKNSKKEFAFEQLVLFVSVLYPLTAVPQIIKVFSRHSAHDLSLVSWIFYAVLEAVLLVYAVRKRLVPIIVQGSLWLIVYLVLIVGIILYG